MSAHSPARRSYCDCIACARAEARHRLKVAGWMLLLGPAVTGSIFYHLGKLCL